MFRKWLSSLVLILAGLSLIAACSSAPAPQAAAPTPQTVEKIVEKVVTQVVEKQVPVQQTVVVEKQVQTQRPKMTLWLSTSFTPLADELQKRYALEWANAKGVELTIVQDSSTVLAPQLNAAIETKNLPDVLSWASPDWAPKLARLGLALDVTDVVQKNNAKGGGLYDPALRAVTQNGKAFAVPTYSATELFYVRKDLLAAKGLKAPETWEDVAQVAKAVTEKGKLWGYGMSLGMPSYDAEISLMSMLASYGATPYGADGKTPNLNNEGTRQVIALAKDMWDAGAVIPDAVTWDDSGNNKAYLTGAAAMIYNTGSVLNSLRKDDPDLLSKTDVVKIPKGPKGAVILGYIYGLIGTSTSKNPELAKDLLSYLSDPERQGKIVEAAGTNYMPLYKDLGKAKMWEDPTNQLFIQQLAGNNAIGYPGPTTEWALEAWRTHTITEMFNRILVDKVSPDDAIKQTEEKLVKIYQQYNK